MKTSVRLHSISRVVPVIIGLLLIYAGVYKLIFPGEATRAVQALVGNQRVASILITAVTISELYVGALLTFRIDLRFALPAATAVFFLFTCYLWYLSTMAHPPACGCLGLTLAYFSNKANAVFGIIRNCIVLWLLKAAYDSYFVSGRPSSNPVSTS